LLHAISGLPPTYFQFLAERYEEDVGDVHAGFDGIVRGESLVSAAGQWLKTLPRAGLRYRGCEDWWYQIAAGYWWRVRRWIGSTKFAGLRLVVDLVIADGSRMTAGLTKAVEFAKACCRLVAGCKFKDIEICPELARNGLVEVSIFNHTRQTNAPVVDCA
jgi:hypothetical protein